MYCGFYYIRLTVFTTKIMNFVYFTEEMYRIQFKPETLTRELKPYTKIKNTSMSLMALSRLRKLICHVRIILNVYFLHQANFLCLTRFRYCSHAKRIM
jgi:hypothetical protein